MEDLLVLVDEMIGKSAGEKKWRFMWPESFIELFLCLYLIGIRKNAASKTGGRKISFRRSLEQCLLFPSEKGRRDGSGS